jgi:hypothetical protein
MSESDVEQQDEQHQEKRQRRLAEQQRHTDDQAERQNLAKIEMAKQQELTRQNTAKQQELTRAQQELARQTSVRGWALMAASFHNAGAGKEVVFETAEQFAAWILKAQK